MSCFIFFHSFHIKKENLRNFSHRAPAGIFTLSDIQLLLFTQMKFVFNIEIIKAAFQPPASPSH